MERAPPEPPMAQSDSLPVLSIDESTAKALKIACGELVQSGKDMRNFDVAESETADKNDDDGMFIVTFWENSQRENEGWVRPWELLRTILFSGMVAPPTPNRSVKARAYAHHLRLAKVLATANRSRGAQGQSSLNVDQYGRI